VEEEEDKEEDEDKGVEEVGVPRQSVSLKDLLPHHPVLLSLVPLRSETWEKI